MGKNSRRIEFEDDDLEFMQHFREETGVDMQTFVDKAVKDKIAEIKVQQYLNEK